MDYVKAILIKFVATAVVLWLVLSMFYGFSIGQVLLLSVAITFVGFILGDLIILSKFENWGAVIADFILVFGAVWLYGTYFTFFDFPILTAAGISALAISIFEVFFHRYVDSHILHVDNRTGDRTGPMATDDRLQTEFGEESDPIDAKDDY